MVKYDSNKEVLMKKDSGLVYGFGAYILWGILPLYWKLLGGVSSIDILFYRIIWSLIFMLLYMIALRKMPTFIQEVKVLLKNRKRFSLLLWRRFSSH
jgi:chloramphenicol-sensitive protein RarD